MEGSRKASGNVQMVYNGSYSKFIKRFIGFQVKFPKIAILLPVVICFLLSYNVTYEYGVKQINNYLGSNISGDKLFMSQSEYKEKRIVEWRIIDGWRNHQLSDNRTHTTLSFMSLQKRNGSGNLNVLDHAFFMELATLESKVRDKFPDVEILSPLSNWPFNLSCSVTLTPDENINFRGKLSQFINYGKETSCALFIDDVIRVNHLIGSAQVLNIYVFFNDSQQVLELIENDIIPELALIEIRETVNIDEKVVQKEILDYFLLQYYNTPWFKTFILNFLLYLMIPLYLILLFYMYVSISNVRKVRSVFGLLIGWIVEVFVATNAALSLVGLFWNENKTGLESIISQKLVHFYVFFAVSLTSSKNVLMILGDLIGDYVLTDEASHITKKLFRLYLGLNNKNQYDGFYTFAISKIPQLSKFGAPNVSKSLFMDIAFIGVSSIAFTYIFSMCVYAQLSSYLNSKLHFFTVTTIVGLILDHVLQLSYLIGIIIFDLKRYELCDILSYRTHPNDDSNSSVNSLSELLGPNIFSSFLLGAENSKEAKRKGGPASMRRKLGEYLLKVNCTKLIASFSRILYVCFIMHFIILVYLNWLIHSSFMDSGLETKMKSFSVIRDENNHFYYMEYVCIFSLVIAVSMICFRVTKSQNNMHVTWKLSESDFILEDERKGLHSIDLYSNTKAHQLDVIMIASNPQSPYFVSVGLDHRILVWAPSYGNREPIDICTTYKQNGQEKEFWPVDRVDISSSGNLICLLNFRSNVIKCYNVKDLDYKWESAIISSGEKMSKTILSFFRRRTVAGYLQRKMIQKNILNKGRRPSTASITSFASKINGNHPFPDSSSDSTPTDGRNNQFENTDYVSVFENGDLLVRDCEKGIVKSFNILSILFDDELKKEKFIVFAKFLKTPRVNDRIVCLVNDFSVIVGHAVNNNWRFQTLNIIKNEFVTPKFTNMMMSNSLSYSNISTNDRETMYEEEIIPRPYVDAKTSVVFNKPTLVPIEFVGMMVRINNFVAEIFDVQTGNILKQFNVGPMKQNTAKVTHSPPTHCQFCGCASVKSLSLIYEDSDSNTIIVHTFKIKARRAKDHICLRVERDPREIRCLGLNVAQEEQMWFEDLECWKSTELDMIIGVKKKEAYNVPSGAVFEEVVQENVRGKQNLNSLIENSGLMSLRSRNSPSKKSTFSPVISISERFEGFVVSLSNGKLISYDIPNYSNDHLYSSSIGCCARFGFKAIIVSFGNLIKILYLGNEKLIETDIYSNMGPIQSELPLQHVNPSLVNNSLLFLDRKRKL